MPKSLIKRDLPYSRKVLFDVVADVVKYPEFVPWCKAARLVKQINKDCFDIELIIGFKNFRESYISRVTLDRKSYTVCSIAESRLFEKMINNWQIDEQKNGTCKVHCRLDYDFRSRLLSGVASVFFNYVSHHIIEAFEKRALELASKT